MSFYLRLNKKKGFLKSLWFLIRIVKGVEDELYKLDTLRNLKIMYYIPYTQSLRLEQEKARRKKDGIRR